MQMTPPKTPLTVDLGDGAQREIRITAARQKQLDEKYEGNYLGKLASTQWADCLPLVVEALRDRDGLDPAAVAEIATRADVDAAVNQIVIAITGKTTDELALLAVNAKNAPSGQSQ
jgi:hypothetical protein